MGIYATKYLFDLTHPDPDGSVVKLGFAFLITCRVCRREGKCLQCMLVPDDKVHIVVFPKYQRYYMVRKGIDLFKDKMLALNPLRFGKTDDPDRFSPLTCTSGPMLKPTSNPSWFPEPIVSPFASLKEPTEEPSVASSGPSQDPAEPPYLRKFREWEAAWTKSQTNAQAAPVRPTQPSDATTQ